MRRKGSHTQYDIEYHIVWTTKYRYKILKGKVAERARELAAESKLKAVQNFDSITSAAIDTVGDVAALATLIEDNDEDEDKHYAPVDRKRLKEEWEKKESLGMHMG